MPTTTLTPHAARSTSLARDALYAQAVHVLHVTAQHWGMALRAQTQPDKAALRSRRRAQLRARGWVWALCTCVGRRRDGVASARSRAGAAVVQKSIEMLSSPYLASTISSYF